MIFFVTSHQILDDVPGFARNVGVTTLQGVLMAERLITGIRYCRRLFAFHCSERRTRATSRAGCVNLYIYVYRRKFNLNFIARVFADVLLRDDPRALLGIPNLTPLGKRNFLLHTIA